MHESTIVLENDDVDQNGVDERGRTQPGIAPYVLIYQFQSGLSLARDLRTALSVA
jgi:hypothetical protein